MIELTWENFRKDLFQQITVFLSWVLAEVEKEKIDFHGYMVFNGKEGNYHTMLFTDGVHAKKLLKILQQPPEEYKERYIACIPCEEPNPVHEVKQEQQDEEDIDVPEKT